MLPSSPRATKQNARLTVVVNAAPGAPHQIKHIFVPFERSVAIGHFFYLCAAIDFMSVLPLIDETIFPGHYILKQLEHIHVRGSIGTSGSGPQ